MLKTREIKKMTNGERASDVYELIRSITDPELLRRIGDMARREIKDRAQRVYWAVGQTVQLIPAAQGKRPWDAKGKVMKVNLVKLVVDFNGQSWNIPKSILQKME